MRTPAVALGDLVTITGGGTPSRDRPDFWSGSVPWASVKDLKGPVLATTEETITPAGLADSAAALVASGALIVATRMGLGKVAVNAVPLAINQDLKALRVGDRADTNYLLHFLLSKSALLESMGKGATVKGIKLDALQSLRVPLPPLAEQRRIAALLDKADAIRRKRQQAIRLADGLLRSAFLDMFGDPVTNPKGWPTQPIAELAEVITGNTPPRERPEYYGDAIEWIKSDNINTPSHVLTPATEGLSAVGRALARTAPKGSTLMTCIAGSQSCIGNAALTDRTVAFNQQINAVVPRPPVDAHFLYVELLLSKPLIQAASTGAMKGMVSKGRLSSLRLPVPPSQRQRAFGVWFSGVLSWRLRLDAATAETDHLFDSLVQHSFREALQPG